MFVKFKDEGDYKAKYPGLHRVISIEEFNGKEWDYRVYLGQPLGFTNVKKDELVDFNSYLQWLKQ